MRELRTALATARVDASEYAGHSFLIGAASTAASVGMPEFLIKTFGRWESAAYVIYQDTTNSVVQKNFNHATIKSCCTLSILKQTNICDPN